MIRYNSRKAMLSAAVAISTIVVSAAVDKSAMAQDIIYTGTQNDFDTLLGSVNSLRPKADANQSGNSFKITDPGALGDNYKAPGGVYGGFNNLYGGIELKDNQVLVDGGKASFLFGGYSYAETGSIVTGNSVVVSGGTVRGAASGGGGGFNSRDSDMVVTGNSVVVSGGSVGTNVSGGLSTSSSTSSGNYTVADNSATVSGGTVGGNVFGGYSTEDPFSSINHSSLNVMVTGNTVTVSGGTVQGTIFGGSGTSGIGGSDNLTVTGNRVTVSGGTVGDIYGGYGKNSSTGDITVTNNIVTLDGDFVRGSVYGGYAIEANGDLITDFNKVVSGNTLNLNGYRGTVAGIHNFENYNWVLPKNVVNDDTLIHITGDAVDLNQTKHTIAMENDGNRLNAGDKIVMIDKVTGTPMAVPTEVTQGQFLVYDVDVKVDDDQFVLSVVGKDDAEPVPTPGVSGFLCSGSLDSSLFCPVCRICI